MRLIDADLLKATVPEVEPDSYEDCENCDMMGDIAVRELIDAAPTVDAVPVVRCRNCINFAKTWVNGEGFRICPASGMDITPDDYCSYGQHKDQSAQVRKMEDSHNVTKENT